MSFNEHDINGMKVRINKPENIKEIKNALLTDQDSHSIKHYKDIEKIIVSGGVTLNKTLI
jgi:N-methylhydantoinase A/oxoprolinase/acetone carboxylase beta subunit